MSVVARGIAEADSVGIAANAQAATPISNRRFILEVSLDRAIAGMEVMFREPVGSICKSGNADSSEHCDILIHGGS
jgi:hypothetical protein